MKAWWSGQIDVYTSGLRKKPFTVMVIEAGWTNLFLKRKDADRIFLADIEAATPEECRAIIREYYPGVETIVVEGDQMKEVSP